MSATLTAFVIEDEPPARAQLVRQLRAQTPPVEVVGEAGSCAEAAVWLAAHPPPAVIFSDIMLGDGSALSLFEASPPPAPVVFCTAFDRYVMQALERGGVDYLLKPIGADRLTRAVDKIRRLQERPSAASAPAWQTLLSQLAAPPQRRFIVRRGSEFVSVPLAAVAYFTSQHKLTVLVERSGRTSYVDDTLTALEHELSSAGFHRAHRAYLLTREAVSSFKPHTKGRLSLKLEPPSSSEVLVSAQNAAAFRAWLSGQASVDPR